MSERIRAAAERRRDAALAEVRRWEEFLRTYDEAAALAEGLELDGSIAALSQATGRPQEQVRRAVAQGALYLTEQAALAAIEAAGRPIPTRELLPLVLAQGIEVGGADQIGTLSARLSRSNRLENRRPYGWAIRKEPGVEPPDDDPLHEASGGSLFQPDTSGESPAGGGT